MSGKRTGRGDERYRTDGGQDDLTDLQGIGPARADRLRDAGFESFEDIRVATRDDLVDVLGPELTDQILEQIGGSDRSDEGADAAEAESADAGPSVPSDDESAAADDSGPSVPDDSGPSVPSGSGERATGDDGESRATASGGDAGRDGESASRTAEVVDDATAAGTSTARSGAVEQSTEVKTQDSGDSESLLAALLSFLIVPGLGNIYAGNTDRGAIIFVVYVVWLIVGWGIGLFLVGGFLSAILAAFTFGIGGLIWFLFFGVVALMEFAIRLITAYDAYRQSELVDSVTVKVNQVRDN